MMKKNFVILGWLGIVMVLISYGPCIPQNAMADPPIKWKMTTTWTPGLANLLAVDKHFVELVNTLANGELEIKLFDGDTLVPPYQVLDATSKGTVNAGADWCGYWAGKDTAFSLLGSYPFGLTGIDYMVWIYQGGGLELYQEVYGKFGVVAFPHMVTPPESGIRSNKPINSIADFKGLKVRMSGKPQGQLLNDLGGAHVALAGSELYQALDKGVIDATEWSTPDGDWPIGLQEVTKYWLLPAGWHQPASVHCVFVNKESWDKLPDHLKEVFKIAAMANISWSFSYREFIASEYAKKFIDYGIKTTRLSNDDIKTLQEMSNKNTLEFCKENPMFAKVAYSQFKFMQDISQWRSMSQPFTYGRNTELPDLDAMKTYIK